MKTTACEQRRSTTKFCNEILTFRRIGASRFDEPPECDEMRLLLCAALVCAAGSRTPLPGRMSRATAPTPAGRNIDYIIDISSSDDDLKIMDVDDEAEESGDATQVLCLAPPCGLKMPPQEISAVPVPWKWRLPAPDA